MQILRVAAICFSLVFVASEGSAGGQHSKVHKRHKGHKGHKPHHHHKGHHHHHKHRKEPSAAGPNASQPIHANASGVTKLAVAAVNAPVATSAPAAVKTPVATLAPAAVKAPVATLALVAVKAPVATVAPAAVKVPVAAVKAAAATHKDNRDDKLIAEIKALELRVAKKKDVSAVKQAPWEGHLFVNGPLPADFPQRFTHAVAQATGVDASQVTLTKTAPVPNHPGVVAVDYKAAPAVVTAVEDQSADPDSKLGSGSLHSFLVEKDGPADADSDGEDDDVSTPPKQSFAATPVEKNGIDIDTAMPYGDLEPFGREDTAQELTEESIRESDAMVDQVERAEVAEEKRATFRALTRLRGAAITSFDGVARSQTGNIDEYNQIHQWRKAHPLHHLADEESDVSKWAFPDNAD